MFKKTASSPKLFLSLAILSLLIVFSAFFYLKTEVQGVKNAYWQYRLQKILGISPVKSSQDPLISQANSADTAAALVANPADPSAGKANARVTIFEFSDFTCAYCNKIQPILNQVKITYGNQVRIVWQDFPLTTAQPEALKASRAARCAGNKFWAYHDLLFANQGQLSYDNYLEWAKQLNLDQSDFADCLKNNDAVNESILRNIETGNDMGVPGVPSFYINGQILSGQVTFEDFKKVIDKELEKQI